MLEAHPRNALVRSCLWNDVPTARRRRCAVDVRDRAPDEIEILLTRRMRLPCPRPATPWWFAAYTMKIRSRPQQTVADVRFSPPECQQQYDASVPHVTAKNVRNARCVAS